MSKKTPNVMQQLRLDKYFWSIIGTQPPEGGSTPASGKGTPEDWNQIERTRKESTTKQSIHAESVVSQIQLTKSQKDKLLQAETQMDTPNQSPFVKSVRGTQNSNTPSDKYLLTPGGSDISTNRKGNFLMPSDMSTKKPTPTNFNIDLSAVDPGLRFDPQDFLDSENNSVNNSPSGKKTLLKQDTRKKLYEESKKPNKQKIHASSWINTASFDENDIALMEQMTNEQELKKENTVDFLRNRLEPIRELDLSGSILELPKFDEINTDSMEERFVAEVAQNVMDRKFKELQARIAPENKVELDDPQNEYLELLDLLEGDQREESTGRMRNNSNSKPLSESEGTTFRWASSKKAIKFEKEKLQKASKLFEDDDDFSNLRPQKSEPASRRSPLIKDEQTKNNEPNKSLNRQETLKKVMKLFGDEEENEINKMRFLAESQFNSNMSKSLNIINERSKESTTTQIKDIDIPKNNPSTNKSNLLSPSNYTNKEKNSPRIESGNSSPNIGFSTANMKAIKIDKQKIDNAKRLFEEDILSFPPSQKMDVSKRLVVNQLKSFDYSQKLFKEEEPKKIFNLDLSNYKLNPSNAKGNGLHDKPKSKLINISNESMKRVMNIFKSDKDMLDEIRRSPVSSPLQQRLNEEYSENNSINVLKPTTESSRMFPQFEESSNPKPVEEKSKSKIVSKQENSQGLWPEPRKDGPKLLKGTPKLIVDPLEPLKSERDSSKKIVEVKKVKSVDKPKIIEPKQQPQAQPQFFGFSTAKGDKLKIDSQKLRAAESLMETEDPDPEEFERQRQQEDLTPKLKDMQEKYTMKKNSNHQLKLKKENLERALKLLADDDLPSPDNQPVSTLGISPNAKGQTKFQVSSPKHTIKIIAPQTPEDGLLLPTEDDEEDVQQAVKRIMPNGPRKSASPQSDISLKDTTNLRGRLQVRSYESNFSSDRKISGLQGFKFTKENSDSKQQNYSKKSPSYQNNSSKMNIENNNMLRVEKKNPLKRTFDNFLQDSEGNYINILSKLVDQENSRKRPLEDNPKIKQFFSTLKIGMPSQFTLVPHHTYFTKDNLLQDPHKTKKDLFEITINNALQHKFVCPCVNTLQSQLSSAPNSQTSTVCYCNGSMVIGWSELRRQLIDEGLKAEYVTEVSRY